MSRHTIAALLLVAMTGCQPPGEAAEEELAAADGKADGTAAGPGDPKSSYRHLPLPRGGQAFVQGAGDFYAIDANDVAQGHINDCWIMSALISIARMNPLAIERLIRKRADGNYDVTLYFGDSRRDGDGVVHRDPVVVTVAPTFAVDAEGKLVYAQPRDTGSAGPELWPLLIEKAYAKYLGRYEGPIPVLGSDLNGNDVPAFNALLPSGERETFDPGRQTDDRIVEVIGGAFDARRPATALVTIPGSQALADEWGIVTWHHYSIAGIDRSTQAIDLEDPVRSRTAPKGMPVDVFRRIFTFYHLGGDASR